MAGKSVPYKVTFRREDTKATEFVYIFNFEEKSGNPLENVMDAYHKSLAELLISYQKVNPFLSNIKVN